MTLTASDNDNTDLTAYTSASLTATVTINKAANSGNTSGPRNFYTAPALTEIVRWEARSRQADCSLRMERETLTLYRIVGILILTNCSVTAAGELSVTNRSHSGFSLPGGSSCGRGTPTTQLQALGSKSPLHQCDRSVELSSRELSGSTSLRRQPLRCRSDCCCWRTNCRLLVRCTRPIPPSSGGALEARFKAFAQPDSRTIRSLSS